MGIDIRPTAKQELFILSPEDEVFYGGARGGGKTFACLLDFFGAAIEYSRHAQGILFRRTYKELEEAIKISKEIFRSHADWRVGDKQWTFRNGAVLKLRYLERDEDVEKYQGHSFTNIYFDELGNYPTDYPYLFMFSSLRSVSGVPCYMRATGNPGGVGAYWIKERFVTNKNPMEVYHVDGITRQFIPARLEDNPLLAATNYEDRLKTLPAHLYKAFRLGDWDVFAGQVFSEWDQSRHIIEPFPLDPSWYRFASMDWGFAKPYSIGFWAKTHEGRLIRFAEIYGKVKANVGTREQASVVAKKAGETAAFLGVEDMVADPACWSNQGYSEESIEQIFSQYFVMMKGKNDRLQGAYAFHDYLKTNLSDGGPMLCVFPGCEDFIRTIPAQTADKKRPEDIDTRGEDHCFDLDTIVKTSEGNKRFRDIIGTTGEIETINGLQSYDNCRVTRESKCIELTFDDGYTIICTPDHKFMTWNGEWIEALSLLGEICYDKAWNTNHESLNDIKEYGKKQMDPFKRVYISIILIVMKLMTLLRISSYSRQKNMREYINSLILKSQCRKNVWKKLRSGILAKKVLSGIMSIIRKIKRLFSKEKQRCVMSAKKSTKGGHIVNTVHQDAKHKAEEIERSMKLQEYVFPAEKGLTQINIQVPKHAPENAVGCTVVAIRDIGTRQVACINVSSLHSFSVSRYVVSNCYDEARYAIMHVKADTIEDKGWTKPQQAVSLLRRGLRNG